MKVGTDGVLLGAWAGTESCNRILDIGTGTGLIALMLAQRSKAVIDAIDIDADACLQAQENAESSPFAGRINVRHCALADFAQAATNLYDLIVSNPPYFVDSLKCPDRQRNTARHTDTLTLEDLLQDSRKLLAPQGRIALIPALRPERASCGLHPNAKPVSFERNLRHTRARRRARNGCWPN